MSSRKYPNAEPVSTEALADSALDEIEVVFIKTNNQRLSVDTLTKIRTEVNCIMLEQLITSPGTRALLSLDTITLIEQHLAKYK
jgi:hypothetical protein